MTGKADAVNFMYKSKYFIALALVAVLVTAQASSAYSISSSTVATYNQFSFVTPQSYTVFTDGTTTYAKSGATGAIDYSGTNATIVIQSALDHLTAGRTYKETVTIRGDYTISGMIQVPSYTVLTIDGKLTEASSRDLPAMIRNENYGVSVDSNIEIHGGILDGNKAGGSTGHGIQLDGVTDSLVQGVTVKNVGGASGRGIYITTTSPSRTTERVIVADVFVSGATNSNIEFAGSAATTNVRVNMVRLSNLISIDSGQRGLILTNVHNSTFSGLDIANTVTHGIDLSYNSTDNAISNFAIRNTGMSGINDDTFSSTRNVYSNGRIYNATLLGFTSTATDLALTNMIISDSGQDGVRLASVSDRCVITDVISKNNGKSAANTYHGFVLLGTDNCILVGNSAYDDQAVKTQRFGIVLDASSDNNIVTGNNVSGNLQANGISNSGTGNIIRNNKGYVTENTGTATINSGSTSVTVNHGLSYTPTAAELSIIFTNNPTNDPGNWWISNITSTQFTINVRSDPGAGGLNISWADRKV